FGARLVSSSTISTSPAFTRSPSSQLLLSYITFSRHNGRTCHRGTGLHSAPTLPRSAPARPSAGRYPRAMGLRDGAEEDASAETVVRLQQASFEAHLLQRFQNRTAQLPVRLATRA